ncbi:DUF3667 domain-containing protein [Pseudotamlana carrageenivorans]|uniref:DUF3667 domain-containing protein n=1 Tax=Pseudotamlana carrageenivorans TaxID=2069432 RepID=A0A2I7SL65_9FLAO|nr:DUF3667 domain-containing protein [Tamlana carrageenivorans]AUS06665.1 hypothetical protein C1A40_14975 [Tamlana carrageenivorans]
MKNKEICKNCEKQFKSSFDFCPFCGQQVKDRLTVKVLFYNIINNYFAVDGRLMKSIFPLLFKPGFLAQKFIEGKRLQYLHPVQMYLFVSILFYFLFSFVQNEQVKNLDKQLKHIGPKASSSISQSSKGVIDSVDINRNTYDSLKTVEHQGAFKDRHVIANFSEKRLSTMLDSTKEDHKGILSFDFNAKLLDSLIISGAPKEDILVHMGMSDTPGYLEKRFYTQSLRFYETRKGGRVLQTFYDTIPIAIFFLLPIFALILKSFYFKNRLYAEYLVFSFYYFSFIYTVLSFMLIVYFLFEVPFWLDWGILLILLLYLIIAIKNFYNQSWFYTFFKTLAISFIFLSIVIPITVIVLSVFAFLYF